jgi:hypothetical protein
MGSVPLPYWQVNVPPEHRTAECPECLRNLSAKDLGIISTPDSEFTVFRWPQVQQLVASNRIDLFQRMPSELRRYRAFIWKLNQEYGSVMSFILSERLHWSEPLVPTGPPFERPSEDMKILYNDWPYGIDSRIVHLVIWTKFELVEDPATGDLTDAARAEIDGYVEKTFRSRIPKETVSENTYIEVAFPHIFRQTFCFPTHIQPRSFLYAHIPSLFFFNIFFVLLRKEIIVLLGVEILSIVPLHLYRTWAEDA